MSGPDEPAENSTTFDLAYVGSAQGDLVRRVHAYPVDFAMKDIRRPRKLIAGCPGYTTATKSTDSGVRL